MKRSIESVEVSGKRVLLRADFNSPVDHGKIVDDTRIKATMPTIIYLLSRGAKLIMCSHQGRPDGKVDPQYSLAPIANHISELLGKPVLMASDCVGKEVCELANTLTPGYALMLENLRFHKEEEECDQVFSKQLATLGDVYVNDAFGTSHRKHASIYGVPQILKPAVAGFLMIKELQYLGETIKKPKRPFAVVFGGAKVSDKIKAVVNLAPQADIIIIGGGMSYTFLSAMGRKIGNSILQKDQIETCRQFLELTPKDKVFLPIDVVATDNIKEPKRIVTIDGDVPEGLEGVDIGPKTRELFCKALSKCQTVLWNGPLGVYENPRFANGTREVMECVAKNVPVSVIGGGDSASAAAKFGLSNAFTHISTGGGASLEFLEGKELPGISVLDDV